MKVFKTLKVFVIILITKEFRTFDSQQRCDYFITVQPKCNCSTTAEDKVYLKLIDSRTNSTIESNSDNKDWDCKKKFTFKFKNKCSIRYKEYKLLAKYNLKPILVQAFRDLELQVSGTKEELARRIVESEEDGTKLAYLVRRIEQIDPEDLEFSYREPKEEVNGTKSKVVENVKKESTRNSLELMKSVKTMRRMQRGDFYRTIQLALSAAGLSPQSSEATSWLLMKVSDDIQFRLQEYFVNIEEVSSTILCGKLRNWYSTAMTRAEAECELIAFKLDQKNIEESLKKLKNLVSAQNVHLARKDKNDRIRYEILRQWREIPNLENLGLIGRNFLLDELEAELKIECKLENLHISKNNEGEKNYD